MLRLSVNVELRGPSRPPRRHALMALVFAGLLLLPTSAIANHQFTDVPTGHIFHDDIAAAYGGRITTGCTPTTFCPDNALTRGQMTAFLNRGLGRVVRTNLLATASSSTAVSGGTVTITAGNATGGTAWVYVTTSVNAYVTAGTCPCEATIVVTRGGIAVSTEAYMDLSPVAAPDDDSDATATSANVIAVPTGVPQTFSATFQRKTGTAPIYMNGTLIAMVIPFNGTGDPPSEEAPAEAPVGKEAFR